MKSNRIVNRIAIGAALALCLSLPVLLAQGQITQLTRGDGGVGRLVLGLGTGGAATVANARVTMTNAQVLALHTTPITVVPAPGAGYVIDVIDGLGIFDYTGAYTAGAGVDLRLFYSDTGAGIAASNVIETTGWLTASADAIRAFSGVPDDTNPRANSSIVIQEVTGVALGGGNASNQVDIDVTYVIRRTGL